MNIQFSVTTIPNVPVKTPEPATEAAVNELGSRISASRGTKDLDRLEQQGAVSVSPGDEQLVRKIEKAVKSLAGPQTTLDISIHEKTHEIMVKVLNKDTGEIIREVPTEKTLDLVAKMMELAGILIDKRV